MNTLLSRRSQFLSICLSNVLKKKQDRSWKVDLTCSPVWTNYSPRNITVKQKSPGKSPADMKWNDQHVHFPPGAARWLNSGIPSCAMPAHCWSLIQCSHLHHLPVALSRFGPSLYGDHHINSLWGKTQTSSHFDLSFLCCIYDQSPITVFYRKCDFSHQRLRKSNQTNLSIHMKSSCLPSSFSEDGGWFKGCMLANQMEWQSRDSSVKAIPWERSSWGTLWST